LTKIQKGKKKKTLQGIENTLIMFLKKKKYIVLYCIIQSIVRNWPD